MPARARRNERQMLEPLGRIAATTLWRAVGRPFDKRTGVKTEGSLQPSELQIIGANAAHATEYSPSSVRTFWLSAGSLNIDPARFTFVDIGSGKGRALLLAAKLPYRRIEGVEFARDLNVIAARNIEVVFPAAEDRARFELHTVDAVDFAIPSGPCVLYLFNPFGPTLIAQVAQNILDSYRASPREIYVVYANPLHREAFEEGKFRPVEGPWYAKYLDRHVPSGFAIYRLH